MARDNPPIDNKGLAETIDETQQIPEKDLISLLDDVADRFSHHDAIVSLHQEDHLELGGAASPAKPTRWTYSQLRKGSIRLAAHLAAEGMRHGNRIVAVFFNEAEWALLFWATVRLGCQFVPLDPRILDHKKDALHILDKVQPAAVFVSNPTMAERVDGIVKDMEHRPSFKCVASAMEDANTRQGWTTMSKALSDKVDGGLPVVTVDPEDTVLILFTSGTTSRPKGCPHSAVTMGSPALMVVDLFGLEPGHSLCQHLPTFHIFNIFLSLGFWLAGATVVLPSASFDPASCFRAFATSPKMHVPCVPSMVQALTTHASSAPETATSSPFSIILGGAPLTPDILELSRTLGTKQIVAGYGTTEGVATAMNVMDADSLDVVDEEVCIGRVRSGARLRFCQPGSRLPIARGEIGEVHQGGLPVFSGYLDGSPEELAMCYQEQGVNWWASGDRGYLDEEGRLFLLGRYKDLIIRGGENISPVKIENCLGKMIGVHSAYVVGVPDTVAGEVPVAVITRDSQTQVATSDLQAAVLAELGRSFSPTMILDLHKDLGKEKYPTTTSGKIQKPSLRQWVTDYLEQRRRMEQSSNDLLTELLECWSAVTGLAREEINPDASIKTFADSMMIIQFFNMASRKLARYTNSSLMISDTVRQQAEMLQPKKPESTETIASSKCREHEAEPLDQLRAEEVTTSRLAPLGFGWDDVEELIPMTDYFSYFARLPVKPYHWNPRIALVADSSISVVGLRQALYGWLERHPLFRATTVTYDDDSDLYVVMRPSSGWFDLQVTDGFTVDDIAALKSYRLNDASWDWLSRTGPLLKATLVPLRDPPGSTGLVIHVHHVMFDYHTINCGLQDLRDLVSKHSNNSVAPLRHFHHYRSFARSYRTYRNGPTAEEDVNFHVNRLRGISKDPAAIWPPLRHDSDLLPLDPSKRRAFDTISRSVHLPEIAHVQAQAGVSAAMMGKCACTLVNLRHTGASEAIFTTTHSGRLWPTPPPSNSHRTAPAPHPLEIDGPTLVWRVERIPTPSPHETTIQFLRRVAKSQDEMVTHTHAPLGKVLHSLFHPSEGEHNDSETNKADKTLINRILFHQLFNWVLEKINSSSSSASSTATSPLRVVDMLSHADLSLVWAPCLRPDNVCGLDIRYRHGQFEVGEVEAFAGEFLDTMAWLAEPGNLDRAVLECGVALGGGGGATTDGVENGGVAADAVGKDDAASAPAFAPPSASVSVSASASASDSAVADGAGNSGVGDSACDNDAKDEEHADNEGRRKRRKLCT